MGYVKWLGHAAFEIKLDGKVILVDPWLRGNPKAYCSPEEVNAPDIILITHDHSDHLGDSVEIAKRTNPTVVAIYEISESLRDKGVSDVVGMNIGGSAKVKDLEVIMVPAYHSSHIGSPAGYLIVGKEATIYHAGDTGLFGDIKYYAELRPITIALVPIGGLFTMDSLQAGYFVGLFKPKVAIPMHYDTFPAIKANPEDFERAVKKYSPSTRVVILNPGESYEF